MTWNITRYDAVGSTQDEAIALAQDGAPDGTVVVAKEMTGGKGTHGRTWHAPEGGWYASMVLRDIPDPRFVTLALGNAIADVLEVAGAEPRLKWVNDVFVDGKKIAGILVDSEITGDSVDFLVAGIGINLNGHAADYPSELQGGAVTLEDVLGVGMCIEDDEPFILESIAGWLQKVRDGRNDEILAHWRARDFLKGRTVSVADVQGTAEGIDDAGHLLIDGTPVTAGTVVLDD